MSTTYKRIYRILEVSQKQGKWESVDSLANEVRSSRLIEFRMKKEGLSIDDFMKPKSIAKIISLLSSKAWIYYIIID